MHPYRFGLTMTAGAAVVFLTACGDLSDFPTGPSASARPAAAMRAGVPTLDASTPEPTPTPDMQLVQLRAIVARDAEALNGDLDGLFQCEYIITDVEACRSALRGMRDQVTRMSPELSAVHVVSDGTAALADMTQALTALQAGCADDLSYLSSHDPTDNEQGTRELNQGFSLLDQAQLDLPPDLSAVPGGA